MSTTENTEFSSTDAYYEFNSSSYDNNSSPISDNDTLTAVITTALAPPSSADISAMISYVTVPLFGIAGIAGNILSLIIMQSVHFRMSTTSVILSSMAISDTTFILVSPFTKAFVTTLFGRDPKALSDFGCKAYFFMFRTAKFCSPWFVVIICVERFIVIWFPLQAKRIARRRTAIISVILVVVFFFILDGAWTMTDRIVGGNCLLMVSTPSTKDIVFFFTIAGSFVYMIIPTCVLVLLTPLTIFKLFRQMYFRRELSTTSRPDGTVRITTMLLTVTITYIVLVLPNVIAHLIAIANDDSIFTSTDHDFIIFREFAQTCEQLNYSVNFYLYFVCNATFRRQFYALIGCRRSEVNTEISDLRTSTAKSSESVEANTSDVISTVE